MSKSDYVDGFLEGHEPPATRFVYRFAIASFVLLSLFSGAANIGTIGMEGNQASSTIASVAILGLLGLTLLQIKWYRQDNQDPKHRRSTGFLIVMILLLDVSACVAFHNTLSYKAPVAVPPAPPTPTPTPTNVTGLVDEFFRQHELDPDAMI